MNDQAIEQVRGENDPGAVCHRCDCAAERDGLACVRCGHIHQRPTHGPYAGGVA